MKLDQDRYGTTHREELKRSMEYPSKPRNVRAITDPYEKWTAWMSFAVMIVVVLLVVSMSLYWLG